MVLKNLQVCIDVLDDLAPRKKKCTRGNKQLTRTHMKRRQLRNQYLKNRSESNRLAFSKQCNYCVKLLRKTKRDYYALLNKKDVADEKNFWKTIKPLLYEKMKSSEKIYLAEA